MVERNGKWERFHKQPSHEKAQAMATALNMKLHGKGGETKQKGGA